MTLNVLIVDDARDVAEAVGFGAHMNWPDCRVKIAGDGQAALQYFAEEPFDLVVLDVAMPPPDGFEVCQRIRQVSKIPILMLTVQDRTLDKIRALDLGADDYLTKPFDHLELLARMRALVRRLQIAAPTTQAEFTAGDLSVDRTIRQVRMKGTVVTLTPLEYDLLDVLICHAGTVLSHKFLLRCVWGQEYVEEIHYLKEYIHRLRQKLGDDAHAPQYVQTERGFGYCFVGSRYH